MNATAAEVKAELVERAGRQAVLLNPTQYELLRLRGMSKEEVEAFESLLAEEIITRETQSRIFIPPLWVEKRVVEGYNPGEIEYDWVHAFR